MRNQTKTIVLASIPHTAEGNPFSEWLYSNLGPEIDLRWFSWRAALFGRYSIMHLHWPEYLFGGSSRFRTGVKAILGFALLARLYLLRVPVIQTVHTRDPYDGVGPVTRLESRLLCRRIVFRIYLNESPENDLREGCVILLGRYEAPPGYARQRTAGTRLITFGLLRAYKGLENLLAAFRGLEQQGLRLEIMGKALKPEFGRLIANSAALDPRVELAMRRVSDEELSSALSRSDLVVLPYHTMYNSSALLLALDHQVPVLATNSPSNLAIQREVGAAWLQLFDGELDATALSSAIREVSIHVKERATPPDLSRRDWAAIGELHSLIFLFTGGTPKEARRISVWRAHLRAQVEATPAFGYHSPMNLSREQARR